MATITRRLDRVRNDLEDEFKSFYTDQDFANKMEQVKGAGNHSNRPSILRELFDMFDACGIRYEMGRDNAYYEKLIRDSDIPTFWELMDRITLSLYGKYKEYPKPEDYMLRMVNRLSRSEDAAWKADTLRLRILKQFIKYGNYLSAAGFGGKKVITDYVKAKLGKQKLSLEEVLDGLDDGVFPDFGKVPREDGRPRGKYGLLKATDDLAAGKFRMEGATRKNLYLFAMVYDMTFKLAADDKAITDDDRDIEKNLFQDYYTNNLVRFITDSYRGHLNEFERDPSGQGINYKNFAEMVYLYYIARDLSPQEKIKRSAAMIKELKNSTEVRLLPEQYRGTESYRNLFAEDVLDKSEEDFKEFVRENYDCTTFNTGALQVKTEQVSAFKEYNLIMDRLDELGDEFYRYDNGSFEKGYGLWFTDTGAFKKGLPQTICDRYPEIDREDFHTFMELLQSIDSYLKDTKERISSPENITRTALITAWYYYYNAEHEVNKSKDKKQDGRRNLKEIFEDYENELKPILVEKAHYQEFSGKNFFDVAVLVSSYAYINE